MSCKRFNCDDGSTAPFLTTNGSHSWYNLTMGKIWQLIIIGGGPVGLSAALKARQNNYDFLLLESQDKLGGQLIELYPEKEIIDIAGHESILAKNYIDWLLAQFDETDKVRFQLHEKVTNLTSRNEVIEVNTDNNTYQTQAVIIATGLGVYMPRLLECRGAEGCQNIIYALHRLEFLKDKRVAILGGGDAALDWARDISRHTPFVTLIHRRNEFRGDINVIQNIPTLTIKKPFIPTSIKKENDFAYALEIQNVETLAKELLEIDYIFVNYGHIPVSASFGLAKRGPGLLVDDTMQTSTPRIFAIGDVCNYDNKKRRIDAGIQEANRVFETLKTII